MGCQIKRILVCGASAGVAVMGAALKRLMSPKMQARVTLSADGPATFDGLHEACGRLCLPLELGGESDLHWGSIVDGWLADEEIGRCDTYQTEKDGQPQLHQQMMLLEEEMEQIIAE